MKKLVVLFIISLLSVEAGAQKRYNIILGARLVKDYCNNPCSCSTVYIPESSAECLGIDSVKVEVFLDSTLVKKFYTDTSGNCPHFGLTEDAYKIIFSKQGYLNDTMKVDLRDVYNTKKYSDGSIVSWVGFTASFCCCDFIRNGTFYSYAPMKLNASKKKKGVRIISKSR